ncbi:AraC family transcriptional regulator [Paenibacillus sp. OV219]|uniref:helix-turn-helix domain-containing protein n=1 Tax=Paenibacillus sp. OV219 TaxID=1884377 RepID=UPI0008CFA27E|nr:AraC family transcriptional regulator [Paenibacillus sp. OV219]SEO65412.1 AraC-type DNA-binding protein [Paenibacillus sp. OV219]
MRLIADEPLSYGDEEGDFFIQQVRRTKPFERNNHIHRTYEIYYQVSGQRYHFIDDRSYTIAAGDLVFVNKHVVHNSAAFGPLEHERIVINFSDAFLGEGHPLHHPALFEPFSGNARLLRLGSEEQQFVHQLLGRMVTETVERRLGYETYLRVLLTELLLFAARQPVAQEEHSGSGSATAAAVSPLQHKISEVVQHINEHYDTKLVLADLAKRFYISPYYLSRSFKTITGFTLVEYIHLTRVREAQRLLKETDLKVITIAEQTGFENTGHFDRIFKKVAGTTPLGFRKMGRQG